MTRVRKGVRFGRDEGEGSMLDETVEGDDVWVSTHLSFESQSEILFIISQDRLFDSVMISLPVVGKYTDLRDSYMSGIKALEHSAFRVHQKLTISVHHSRTCFFHACVLPNLNDP